MAYRRCEAHKKRLYPNFDRAIHAAMASSRAFGKPFRAYRCTASTGLFHITSQEKRGDEEDVSCLTS